MPDAGSVGTAGGGLDSRLRGNDALGGTDKHKDVVGRPMRLVIVRTADRDGKISELWLVTDRFDLPAELVAQAYRHRWTIELFFRWLKCVLGARHLLSHKQNGVELQMMSSRSFWNA